MMTLTALRHKTSILFSRRMRLQQDDEQNMLLLSTTASTSIVSITRNLSEATQTAKDGFEE